MAPAVGSKSESLTDIRAKLHNVNNEINSIDIQLEELIQKKQELTLERQQQREREKPHPSTEGPAPSPQAVKEDTPPRSVREDSFDWNDNDEPTPWDRMGSSPRAESPPPETSSTGAIQKVIPIELI